MENRVLVLDVANLQFRAIHSYLDQWNRYLFSIVSDILTQQGLEIAVKDLLVDYKNDRKKIEIEYEKEIIEAKKILEEKISNREIFVAPPTFTFLNMITSYFAKLNVDFDDTIIMAQDFSSWRKAEDKKYKQQREEQRQKSAEAEWWNNQYKNFNILYDKLNEALPYHWIKVWLVEADDIASVCCRVYKDKSELILISSDKDWEQLCYFPNVKVFSPITKEFKEIKNPEKILLDKIEKGDQSDNLLDKITNEKEWEHRRKLVDLIHPLPDNIENSIKEKLESIAVKNIYLQKIPYKFIRTKFVKLYKLDKRN